MEILIGLAIILAVNEWRDFKSKKKFSLLESRIKKLSRQMHYVGDLAQKIEANNALLQGYRKDTEALGEFLQKAQTDLQTIVQEYEVNGIPLGLDRGKQQFDMVEGL